MNTIILTVVIALLIGFVLGTLLGLFKKIFSVEVDPKVSQAREALPGANCGGCGYAGCDSFAVAVVKGEAPANGCVAGGPSVSTALNKILGLSGDESDSAKRRLFLLATEQLNALEQKEFTTAFRLAKPPSFP